MGSISRQAMHGPIWGLIAGLAALQVSTFSALGLVTPWREMVLIVLVTAAFLTGSAFYSRVRPDERLARLMRAVPELFLLSYLCGGLSYAGVRLGMPLWDGTMLAWDRALGFDWAAWFAVVDRTPLLGVTLKLAYNSMLPQLALVMVGLVTARRLQALDTYILAYGIAALVTVAIAAVMPCVSPIAYLDLDPAAYPNSDLAMPIEVAKLVVEGRGGGLTEVSLSSAQGLVTFPSFHTVSALLLALAWWHVPWARWPGLALNALMTLSVLSVGSHYLVDLLAGLAVGMGAWVCARLLADRTAFSAHGSCPVPVPG